MESLKDRSVWSITRDIIIFITSVLIELLIIIIIIIFITVLLIELLLLFSFHFSLYLLTLFSLGPKPFLTINNLDLVLLILSGNEVKNGNGKLNSAHWGRELPSELRSNFSHNLTFFLVLQRTFKITTFQESFWELDECKSGAISRSRPVWEL